MAASPRSSEPRRAEGRGLDPKVAQRISHLSLTASRAVEGFLAGRHRSPHRGTSVEFVERRPYVQGDDLRHLDWKAYARTDRLSVKRYEEETNLECTLIVDASGSMAYGRDDGPTKYDYACQLACAISHLVLRERDGAAVALFDQDLDKVIPSSTSPGHLAPITEALATREPGEATDFHATLTRMAERMPRPGLVILISDLFGEPDNLARGLDALCARGHDGVVLHVMHGDELTFPFDRLTRFEGLEADGRLLVDAPALREEFLAIVETWRADVRRACHERSIDYYLFDTKVGLDVALTMWLGRRTARLGSRA